MRTTFFLRSLSFLLVLFLADVAFISCYKSQTYKYKYANLHLEIMDASETTERYLALDHDSLSVKNLFLDVNLTSDLIAKAAAPKALFLSSATAMSPNQEVYINTSRIKSIKVITLANYNNHFPVNSDITGNCLFGFSGARYNNNAFPADAFIEKYNQYIAENESVRDSHIPSATFWFRFKEEPALLPSTQQMEITIELEDGSVLQDESLIFRLHQ
jgi:hypothetical protein